MAGSTPYSLVELQDIIYSIKHRSECPVKYAYFGAGARRFRAVSLHPKYSLARIEMELLANKAINIVHVMRKCRHINVIDLGCGDGTKASILLRRLVQMDYELRYYAVDISKEMLDQAARRVSRAFRNIEVDTQRLDFEESPFYGFTESIRSRQFSVNLVLFLGHTLANVSNKIRVLDNICRSMSHDDFCLIGVELYNERHPTDVENEYDFPQMYDLVFTPLEYLGVPRPIGYFERPKFNFKTKEIELAFVVHKRWDVSYRNLHVTLEPRGRIVLARSYKFTETSLKRDLTRARLKALEPSFKDVSGKFSLTLCAMSSSGRSVPRIA